MPSPSADLSAAAAGPSVAPASRRSERSDVVRNRALLLKAADKLIADNGIDLSLNALAREAGVGVGTVYRHFVDRDEIIAALLEQRIDTVVEVFERCTRMKDPVLGLRTAVLTVCELQNSDRGLWELLAAGRTQTNRESVRRRVVPLSDLLVQRAKSTGRMRPDLDSADLPVMLWVGGALTANVGHLAPTVWRRFVEVMLDGFTAVPGESSREPLSVGPLTIEQTAEVGWAMSGRRTPRGTTE